MLRCLCQFLNANTSRCEVRGSHPWEQQSPRSGPQQGLCGGALLLFEEKLVRGGGRLVPASFQEEGRTGLVVFSTCGLVI